MTSNHECPICAIEKLGRDKRYTQQYILDVIENKNGNILLNPTEYINCNCKNLKVICGGCKKTYITSFSLTRNYKKYCPSCTPKKKDWPLNKLDKTYVEKYINQINGNLLLNKDDYINSKERNLNILCGTCKQNIFTTSFDLYKHAHVDRCRKCSSKASKAEYKIMDYLDNKGIEYEFNYRFTDCVCKNPLPFDFFIKSYNCCIEFEGYHHYYPVKSYGGIDHLLMVQEHDEIKNQYCIYNNIKLIRIPFFYSHEIEQILDEDLLGISKTKPIKIIPKYRTK